MILYLIPIFLLFSPIFAQKSQYVLPVSYHSEQRDIFTLDSANMQLCVNRNYLSGTTTFSKCYTSANWNLPIAPIYFLGFDSLHYYIRYHQQQILGLDRESLSAIPQGSQRIPNNQNLVPFWLSTASQGDSLLFLTTPQGLSPISLYHQRRDGNTPSAPTMLWDQCQTQLQWKPIENSDSLWIYCNNYVVLYNTQGDLLGNWNDSLKSVQKQIKTQ